MKSSALLRLAVAAATVVSMGAPSALAAANQSLNLSSVANFIGSISKSTTALNTSTTNQIGGGFLSPSNQTLVTTGGASAVSTAVLSGNASNTNNISMVGF